ncbi:MAG: DUF4011 domain-containing protein, partial [Planctomycetales bacterium]|nr:DUF4011 domain-containing protein [Planctomycetales bacterium]
MSQIRPLASHGQRSRDEPSTNDSGPLPLPAMPGYDQVAPSEVEQRPSTAAGRIDRWQRKLLDLSLRNRLLSFRASKDTVPIVCPKISQLEDRLAGGERMRLISLRDSNPMASRDATLHQQRTQQDLDTEFAIQALGNGELACQLTEKELGSRLTSLYRKVKSDLAEGGSNTLFLAVGFLRWKQKATDSKTYLAPLLLVPVSLTRRSAASPYYLANHEDEVRFNATLIQLLKKDYDCDLT